MTKLAQVQDAILRLAPDEQHELRSWILELETPELLAAIDEAESSLATEGGISLAEARHRIMEWTAK